MKRMIIFLFVLSLLGSMTACGSVRETPGSEPITPAQEMPAETDTAQENPEQVILSDNAEASPADNNAGLEEELPSVFQTVPVSKHADYMSINDDMISTIEKQLQAVRNQDYDAFRATFDLEFISKLMNDEESPEELEEEVQEIFTDFCDEMGEIFQQIDVSDGCLTEVRLYDVWVDDTVETEYIARIKNTEYIVEIEMISYDGEYAVCISDLYEEDFYDDLDEFVSEPKTLDQDMLSLIENQLIAVQNQDYEAFKALFDMDSFLRIAQADDESAVMEEAEESIQILFDKSVKEISSFPDFSVSENCLTDVVLNDIYLDTVTESDYTANIKDTDYVINFVVYSYDNEYIVGVTDILSVGDVTLDKANDYVRTAYQTVTSYAYVVDAQTHSLPEQTINCADGSGAVTEGLGEALKKIMQGLDTPGEVFIGTAEINGVEQIFVQWRASENAQHIGQFPSSQYDNTVPIVWGTFTPVEFVHED